MNTPEPAGTLSYVFQASMQRSRYVSLIPLASAYRYVRLCSAQFSSIEWVFTDSEQIPITTFIFPDELWIAMCAWCLPATLLCRTFAESDEVGAGLTQAQLLKPCVETGAHQRQDGAIVNAAGLTQVGRS